MFAINIPPLTIKIFICKKQLQMPFLLLKFDIKLITIYSKFYLIHKHYVVSRNELQQIVSVNNKIPSGCNRQVLRFKLITREDGAEKVLTNIKMGAALPELHLPFPGTEPEAFIIVCCPTPDDHLALIDLGISLQSMSLRAVEMGLNTLIVGAFNRAKLTEEFSLPLPPVAVLCVGKGAEQFRLVPITADESHAYYRADGCHCVPKVRLDELII